MAWVVWEPLPAALERAPQRRRVSRPRRKLIKAETGKDATAIELTPQELEERISPYKRFH